MSPHPQTDRAQTLSGVYAGPANAAGVEAFAAWRGSPVPIIGDFTGGEAAGSSWTAVSDPASWLLPGLQPLVSQGTRVSIDVPLIVAGSGGTLEAGASGAYDAHFQSLADQLVAAGSGFESTILRLGGEFNGSWEPYAITPGGANSAENFIAFWRHLVQLFRTTGGTDFTFCWCPNIGTGTAPPDAAYPGGDYVDYVGLDVYDFPWEGDGGPTARWQVIEGETYGLSWWNRFAEAHGKPFCIPEWGAVSAEGGGGGDNPHFISQMRGWIDRHQPAFELYFNCANSLLSSGGLRQCAATYRQLWG